MNVLPPAKIAIVYIRPMMHPTMERMKPVMAMPLPLGFLNERMPRIKPAIAMRIPKTGIQQKTSPQYEYYEYEYQYVDECQ